MSGDHLTILGFYFWWWFYLWGSCRVLSIYGFPKDKHCVHCLLCLIVVLVILSVKDPNDMLAKCWKTNILMFSSLSTSGVTTDSSSFPLETATLVFLCHFLVYRVIFLDLNATALSVTILLGHPNLDNIFSSRKSIITVSISLLVGIASIHC